MSRMTRVELEEENDELRRKLEEVYDSVGTVLEASEDDEADEDDGEDDGEFGEGEDG